MYGYGSKSKGPQNLRFYIFLVFHDAIFDRHALSIIRVLMVNSLAEIKIMETDGQWSMVEIM